VKLSNLYYELLTELLQSGNKEKAGRKRISQSEEISLQKTSPLCASKWRYWGILQGQEPERGPLAFRGVMDHHIQDKE
jgi:hypothetical protein